MREDELMFIVLALSQVCGGSFPVIRKISKRATSLLSAFPRLEVLHHRYHTKPHAKTTH